MLDSCVNSYRDKQIFMYQSVLHNNSYVDNHFLVKIHSSEFLKEKS